MKFIDWWLLFCVIIPFFVFMTEIVWEHNRIRFQYYKSLNTLEHIAKTVKSGKCLDNSKTIKQLYRQT